MVKVGHWKNKEIKIIKDGGEVINVAYEISRAIDSWEIKSYFFQLILFIARTLECLQTELVEAPHTSNEVTCSEEVPRIQDNPCCC